MNKIKLLGCLLAAGLVFAACGDDDGGAESTGASDTEAESNDTSDGEGESDDDGDGDGAPGDYVEAVAQSMNASGEVPFSQEKIDCLAGELVDAIGGPSVFEDAGLSPEDVANSEDISAADLDIGEEQTEDIAASFGACDISLTEVFLSGLGEGASEETRTCLEDNLDDDTLADVFAAQLVSGEENQDLPPELLEQLNQCMGTG